MGKGKAQGEEFKDEKTTMTMTTTDDDVEMGNWGRDEDIGLE